METEWRGPNWRQRLVRNLMQQPRQERRVAWWRGHSTAWKTWKIGRQCEKQNGLELVVDWKLGVEGAGRKS